MINFFKKSSEITHNESSSKIEQIQNTMSTAHSKKKSIYSDLTENQKKIIQNTFEQISQANPEEKKSITKIAELIVNDYSETQDETILKLRNLSFVC
jgi:phage-related tail protein